MNRLECVTESIRHSLNVLAIVAPDWLRQHSQPEWIDRYGPRAGDARFPTSETHRQEYAQQIGVDGYLILDMISADDAPGWLRELPALETLRRIWVQQYYRSTAGVRWRTKEDGFPAAARFISSPYDAEAHYAKKRTTSWVGIQGSSDRNLRRSPAASDHSCRNNASTEGRWGGDHDHP